MDFKEYQTDTNPDGSTNIRRLEIFRLCKRDKTDYDQNWFQRMHELFQKEKAQGFLPSAVIGHEAEPGKEPESVGMIDNLALEGDLVYADVLKIPPADFGKLKDRRFPNRSVELHPETGQLMALSFLGKTRPFHKLPVMEFKGEQVAPVSVIFETDDERQWDKFFLKLKESLGLKPNKDGKMTPQEIEVLKEQIKSDLTTQFKEGFDAEYAKKFKDEFGQTPDEFKAAQASQAKALFAEKVKVFAEKIKTTYHLAPALVDGFLKPLAETFGADEKPIAFAEAQTGPMLVLLEKFAEAIRGAVASKTAIVDFSQTAAGTQAGNPNFTNSNATLDIKFMSEDENKALHEKILRYQEANKIATYEEAAMKYVALPRQ